MRLLPPIIALLLALTSSALAGQEHKPQRIASLNLCTDQILLMLVPRERIASVTHLADQPEYSFTWQQAQGLHKNSGLAEEVVPLQPDLIIASPYSPGSAVKLLEKFGFPIEIVDIPHSLIEVEPFVKHLGMLVGEPVRATQIIDTMHKKMAYAESQLPTGIGRPMTAITYAPNGYTAGKNSLENEILVKSGYRNLTADLGIDSYGNLSVEQLLYSEPDLIVVDDSTNNKNSLAQQITHHPALKKSMGSRGFFHVSTNQWLCAGPMAAEMIEQLTMHRIANSKSADTPTL